MNWVVGITAAKRKPEYLSKTLHSLAGAGWDDMRVFYDTLGAGPYQTFQRALRGLVEDAKRLRANGKPTWCLVAQDDVEFTEGLKAHLDATNPPRDAVLSLYTPAVLDRGDSGWFYAPRMPRSYGALAVMFPLQLAMMFSHNPPSPHARRQTDWWISKWCSEHKVNLYVHSPSFTKHIGEESSIGNHAGINQQYRQCKTWLSRIGGPLEEVTG